jgi:hypothetical protein
VKSATITRSKQGTKITLKLVTKINAEKTRTLNVHTSLRLVMRERVNTGENMLTSGGIIRSKELLPPMKYKRVPLT